MKGKNMTEQLKNQNEYRENGKLTVKRIKRCNCLKKDGEIYTVECRIIQRGCHYYTYRNGVDCICKQYSDKSLWLSADAKAMIENEVCAFDTTVASAETDEFCSVYCEDAKLLISYCRLDGEYDFVLKYENERTGQTTTELLRNTDVMRVLRCLKFCDDICDSKTKTLFRNPTAENISDHPLVVAARKNNDTILEKSVKLFCNLETEEDCSALAEMLGVRILPPLPEEFDREYVVDVSTITPQSFELLKRSGYKIWHRPCFAMKGSTHEKCTFNPHAKTVIDAAKTDSPSISFDDYLGLFEDSADSGVG